VDAGREICGETTERYKRRRVAWWWDETVQQVIKEKNEAYKKWPKSGEEEYREAYKQMGNEERGGKT